MNLRSHLFWLAPLMVGGLLLSVGTQSLDTLNDGLQKKTIALTKTRNDLSTRLAQVKADTKEAKELSQTMSETDAQRTLQSFSFDDFDRDINRAFTLFGLPDLRVTYSAPDLSRAARPDVFSTTLEKYNLSLTGTVIDDRPLFAFLDYLVQNAPMKVWIEKLQIKKNPTNLSVTVNLVWLTNTADEPTEPRPLQEIRIEKWPEQPSLFQSKSDLQESYKAQLYTAHKKFKLSAIFYRSPRSWTIWLDSKKFTDDQPEIDDILVKEVTPDSIQFDALLPFYRVQKNLRLRPNQAYYPECACFQEGETFFPLF